MAGFTRRTTLAALGAGAVVSVGYALRGILGSPVLSIRLTDGGGMMGATPADMSLYMDMFNRHSEITRTVEEIPGGIRTATESDSPDLVAQLQAHVSSMYTHLDQGAEVMCMSGKPAEETADDPALTQAVRGHALEVTGFVRDGMPAMMRVMLG
jgi:hypothetical protein